MCQECGSSPVWCPCVGSLRWPSFWGHSHVERSCRLFWTANRHRKTCLWLRLQGSAVDRMVICNPVGRNRTAKAEQAQQPEAASEKRQI